MKKINLLLPALFIAFAIGFSSCSDDDDDINVVGMWNIDKYKVEVKILGSVVESDEFNDYGVLNFDEDGTGYIDLGYDRSFTWTLSDKDLDVTGGWEFTGKFRVKSHSSSKMVLENTDIPFTTETYTLSKI